MPLLVRDRPAEAGDQDGQRALLADPQHRCNHLSRLQLNHTILWIEEWIKSADMDFTLYPLLVFHDPDSPSPELSEYGFGDDVIEDGVRYPDPKIKPEPMEVNISEVSGSVAEGKQKEKEKTVEQTEASGSGLTSAEKGKGKAVESESEEEEEEEEEEGSEWGGIPPEDL
ncbi:hypothetical protein DFH07DRAFT_784375 [Mycena maculata]|uniref:Uncharacterized protein n=1 Tax=Mycena maculata TaxID=230809 RepID=A0AAD7MJR8_9AGAR|nr:hypothetical protein DFH07DRAFT_784375 [Mycena maculata]